MDFWKGLFGGIIGIVDEFYYSDEEKARNQAEEDLAKRNQDLQKELAQQQLQVQQNIAIGVGVVAVAGIIGWVAVAKSK